MLPDFFSGNWDNMFSGILEAEQETNFPEPVEVSEEYHVSLHDLFDVEHLEEDVNEEAVNDMFPDWMLTESETAEDSVGDSGVGEELVPEDVDLRCYEEGFPSSESETEDVESTENEVRDIKNEEKEANVLILDCPENPGQGCRACNFHRGSSGNPEAMCALCYMRLTGYCIYSK